jgi:hypothetical protein
MKMKNPLSLYPQLFPSAKVPTWAQPEELFDPKENWTATTSGLVYTFVVLLFFMALLSFP